MSTQTADVANAAPAKKERKTPRFTPPTSEVLATPGLNFSEVPERKTKGGKVRPAFSVAKDRKSLAALFNNDEKSLYYYASLAANRLTRAYNDQHSPDKIAERAVAKAEKIADTMDQKGIEATIAALQAKLAAKK